MTESEHNADTAPARVHAEVGLHVRLLDALQRVAKGSEDAAGVLTELGDSGRADQLLKQAADHYRWAARVAEQATDERAQVAFEHEDAKK